MDFMKGIVIIRMPDIFLSRFVHEIIKIRTMPQIVSKVFPTA
jgi:hypothetical protein